MSNIQIKKLEDRIFDSSSEALDRLNVLITERELTGSARDSNDVRGNRVDKEEILDEYKQKIIFYSFF